MSTLTAPAYATDGVSLDAGDDFSEFAGYICRLSFNNSRLVKVRDWSRGRFRGPRTFRLRKRVSPDCELSADPDGNGTKVILTAAANTPGKSAYDLLAMTGLDGVRYGGRPSILVNQLDVVSLGEPGFPVRLFFSKLMYGLGNAAAEQQIIILKGETAEMGVCVASEDPNSQFKYLWCGTMISVFHPRAFIDGGSLKPGQVAVALRERGLRANGGSSARKGFAMHYGRAWYKLSEARRDIEAAAFPSADYCRFLCFLNGWESLDEGAPERVLRVHAIAHITGGGIPSKLFDDILKPRKLSAELTDLWEPPDIMRKLAKWRGVSGKEPYEIWHGGQGVIAVVDETNVEKFIKLADAFDVEARPSGRIVSGKGCPTLKVVSKFDGETLVWS